MIALHGQVAGTPAIHRLEPSDPLVHSSLLEFFSPYFLLLAPDSFPFIAFFFVLVPGVLIPFAFILLSFYFNPGCCCFSSLQSLFSSTIRRYIDRLASFTHPVALRQNRQEPKTVIAFRH